MDQNITETIPTRFHLSLQVRDLPASARFYAALLGTAPDKLHADYARFSLDDPPLVLSLLGRGSEPPAGAQRLSHLGFRLGSRAALGRARDRLIGAGLVPREEPESRCCYALQDKLWVVDPDGNEWELYVLLRDLPARDGDATGCCD